MLCLEFPVHCIAFWGPHSVECLIDIWLELGCLEEGVYFPDNLNSEQMEILVNLNLK